MSGSIAVPSILNELARAGREGYPLSGDLASTSDLELCRKWGFALKLENGRAFLPFDDDVLVPAWIEQDTPAIAWERVRVQGFLEIGSTNEEALTQARNGAAAGTLIYAEKQTAGRGRKGRNWISPAGVGIYCTLVVRPSHPQKFWPLLTHAAAVALVEALEEILGERSGTTVPRLDLKWPNDVLLSGKKTAGLLLETVVAQDGSRAAVVGIGINVHRGSVPEELRDRATCVSQEAGTEVPRRRLLVRFLYYFQLFYCCFERGEHGELLSRWMERSSMWNGVPIWIDDGSCPRSAVTCGLTELGALRIRNGDGTEETLLAGDVSIRRG